jgi:hypothetical protein
MYINIKTNQYPFPPDQLRAENPNVSFHSVMGDDLLADYSVFPVRQTDAPSFDALTHKAVEAAPIQVGGEWVQQWAVEALSEAEALFAQQQQLEQRITELKQLLRDTDYVALSDYDKDKADVKAQRQAWRDEIRTLEGTQP